MKERAMLVHFGKNTYRFKEFATGFYFLDIADNDNKWIVSLYSALQILADNKYLFSKREIERADKALKYQVKLGWLPISIMISFIKIGQLEGCDITIEEIKRE